MGVTREIKQWLKAHLSQNFESKREQKQQEIIKD